jgi:hypothetical protein
MVFDLDNWGFVVISLAIKGYGAIYDFLEQKFVNWRFSFRNFVYFWTVNYGLALRTKK